LYPPLVSLRAIATHPRYPQLVVVDFDGHQVRSIKIDDEVWFVGKDIIEALGNTWHANRLNVIPDEWVLKDKIVSQVQLRETWLITEQAFYILAHRGNHPRAIEFSRKIAQFTKDVRQGKIGEEELDRMQDDVQMFFGFFTPVPAQQRPIDHKRNHTPHLEEGNSKFWDGGHQLIGKKQCKQRKTELIKRGAPSPLVNRSGLDGLRWREFIQHDTAPRLLWRALCQVPTSPSQPHRRETPMRDDRSLYLI